jgi:hypothetical protein
LDPGEGIVTKCTTINDGLIDNIVSDRQVIGNRKGRTTRGCARNHEGQEQENKACSLQHKANLVIYGESDH